MKFNLGNKVHTGPLSRFIGIVKNPLYQVYESILPSSSKEHHQQPLLNHKTSRFIPIATQGDRWQIIITDQDDNECSFIWCLSKQTAPPFENCWMVDAVIRAG